MKRPLPAAALALALLAVPGPARAARTPADAPSMIRVGRLFTGTEWFSPGVVVIEGGKVLRVGRDIAPGGRVRDFPDAWAVPGLVDAASTTGLAGADSEMTRESTPCVRPLRTFNPADRGVREALASGVTTLFLEPGSDNVVGGIASVVKTRPGPAGRPRVVKETAALRIALGGDPSAGNFSANGVPTSIYARRPTTRMGVLAVLRDAWLLGRAAGPDAEDADLAAMARAAAGEIPVRILARRMEDLRTALRLKDDLGIRPVIEGASEGHLFADRIAAAKVDCVVGPLFHPVNGRGPEGSEPALDNAGAMARAGVAVAISAGRDAGRLREQAAMAVRWGLPREATLRAVTSEAARMCGAGDWVGTIAGGRDADLAVFDGDPLEPSSRVLLVLVDGEIAFEPEGAK